MVEKLKKVYLKQKEKLIQINVFMGSIREYSFPLPPTPCPNMRGDCGKIMPFKLCPMDDTSPGHLAAVGPGYKKPVRALSSFIFLALVRTSH